MRAALLFDRLLLCQVATIFAFHIPRDVSNEHHLVEDDSTKSTLRQVNLVLRHGHRSPQSTYPNDPHKDNPMNPFGWGQLTKKGRASQYNQGLFLRQRYDQFLGPKYNPDVFWLQSTSVDRAKMSALLEAAALWKPDSDQTFIAGLNWQPVTLNYQSSDDDNLLLIWSTCPDYARMREAILKLPDIQHTNEENSDIYAELTRYSGENITNPDDVFGMYSTLQAEENLDLVLPEWANEYYPKKMESLSSLSLKMNVYNDSLLKMKAAPLITKITNNMLEKVGKTLKPKDRKMFMYVGHDSTVVNLLEGMKVWDMQVPFYSIMVIIELHEDEQGHNVQLYLRNTTEHKPYPLTIPGCTFACPIDEFTNLLKSFILTEHQWKEECALKDPNYVPGSVPLP